MKFAFIAAVLVSASAMATEFHAQIENTHCSIVNGTVTRTSSFGKEKIVSFSETSSVKMDGLAPYVRAVTLTSSQMPDPRNSDFSFTMKHEGKTYTLNTTDSEESRILVRMLGRICR